MLIRMLFKEENVLKMGPEYLFPMRAELIAQSLMEAKLLFEAQWDRDAWKNEKQIRVEVRSPLLGHHVYEIDGTENELRIVAEVLEKLFAQH